MRVSDVCGFFFRSRSFDFGVFIQIHPLRNVEPSFLLIASPIFLDVFLSMTIVEEFPFRTSP